MRIFVGNLGPDATDQILREAFSPYGDVTSALVTIDRRTRRSRGSGFVEMALMASGLKAIHALAGTSLNGRKLTVNSARP